MFKIDLNPNTHAQVIHPQTKMPHLIPTKRLVSNFFSRASERSDVIDIPNRSNKKEQPKKIRSFFKITDEVAHAITKSLKIPSESVKTLSDFGINNLCWEGNSVTCKSGEETTPFCLKFSINDLISKEERNSQNWGTRVAEILSRTSVFADWPGEIQQLIQDQSVIPPQDLTALLKAFLLIKSIRIEPRVDDNSFFLECEIPEQNGAYFIDIAPLKTDELEILEKYFSSSSPDLLKDLKELLDVRMRSLQTKLLTLKDVSPIEFDWAFEKFDPSKTPLSETDKETVIQNLQIHLENHLNPSSLERLRKFVESNFFLTKENDLLDLLGKKIAKDKKTLHETSSDTWNFFAQQIENAKRQISTKTITSFLAICADNLSTLPSEGLSKLLKVVQEKERIDTHHQILWKEFEISDEQISFDTLLRIYSNLYFIESLSLAIERKILSTPINLPKIALSSAEKQKLSKVLENRAYVHIKNREFLLAYDLIKFFFQVEKGSTKVFGFLKDLLNESVNSSEEFEKIANATIQDFRGSVRIIPEKLSQEKTTKTKQRWIEATAKAILAQGSFDLRKKTFFEIIDKDFESDLTEGSIEKSLNELLKEINVQQATDLLHQISSKVLSGSIKTPLKSLLKTILKWIDLHPEQIPEIPSECWDQVRLAALEQLSNKSDSPLAEEVFSQLVEKISQIPNEGLCYFIELLKGKSKNLPLFQETKNVEWSPIYSDSGIYTAYTHCQFLPKIAETIEENYIFPLLNSPHQSIKTELETQFAIALKDRIAFYMDQKEHDRAYLLIKALHKTQRNLSETGIYLANLLEKEPEKAQENLMIRILGDFSEIEEIILKNLGQDSSLQEKWLEQIFLSKHKMKDSIALECFFQMLKQKRFFSNTEKQFKILNAFSMHLYLTCPDFKKNMFCDVLKDFYAICLESNKYGAAYTLLKHMQAIAKTPSWTGEQLAYIFQKWAVTEEKQKQITASIKKDFPNLEIEILSCLKEGSQAKKAWIDICSGFQEDLSSSSKQKILLQALLQNKPFVFSEKKPSSIERLLQGLSQKELAFLLKECVKASKKLDKPNIEASFRSILKLLDINHLDLCLEKDTQVNSKWIKLFTELLDRSKIVSDETLSFVLKQLNPPFLKDHIELVELLLSISPEASRETLIQKIETEMQSPLVDLTSQTNIKMFAMHWSFIFSEKHFPLFSQHPKLKVLTHKYFELFTKNPKNYLTQIGQDLSTDLRRYISIASEIDKAEILLFCTKHGLSDLSQTKDLINSCIDSLPDLNLMNEELEDDDSCASEDSKNPLLCELEDFFEHLVCLGHEWNISDFKKAIFLMQERPLFREKFFESIFNSLYDNSSFLGFLGDFLKTIAPYVTEPLHKKILHSYEIEKDSFHHSSDFSSPELFEWIFLPEYRFICENDDEYLDILELADLYITRKEDQKSEQKYTKTILSEIFKDEKRTIDDPELNSEVNFLQTKIAIKLLKKRTEPTKSQIEKLKFYLTQLTEDQLIEISSLILETDDRTYQVLFLDLLKDKYSNPSEKILRILNEQLLDLKKNIKKINFSDYLDCLKQISFKLKESRNFLGIELSLLTANLLSTFLNAPPSKETIESAFDLLHEVVEYRLSAEEQTFNWNDLLASYSFIEQLAKLEKENPTFKKILSELNLKPYRPDKDLALSYLKSNEELQSNSKLRSGILEEIINCIIRTPPNLSDPEKIDLDLYLSGIEFAGEIIGENGVKDKYGHLFSHLFSILSQKKLDKTKTIEVLKKLLFGYEKTLKTILKEKNNLPAFAKKYQDLFLFFISETHRNFSTFLLSKRKEEYDKEYIELFKKFNVLTLATNTLPLELNNSIPFRKIQFNNFKENLIRSSMKYGLCFFLDTDDSLFKEIFEETKTFIKTSDPDSNQERLLQYKKLISILYENESSWLESFKEEEQQKARELLSFLKAEEATETL